MHSNEISSGSISIIGDPIFYNFRFEKETFELLICHDGNNKVHCKVKNLQVLFNVEAPELLSDFKIINHGLFRILTFLTSQ